MAKEKIKWGWDTNTLMASGVVLAAVSALLLVYGMPGMALYSLTGMPEYTLAKSAAGWGMYSAVLSVLLLWRGLRAAERDMMKHREKNT